MTLHLVNNQVKADGSRVPDMARIESKASADVADWRRLDRIKAREDVDREVERPSSRKGEP